MIRRNLVLEKPGRNIVTEPTDEQIMALQADLLKILTKFEMLFRDYANRYPTISLTQAHQPQLQSYYDGLGQLVSGIDAIRRTFGGLCHSRGIEVSL
jgi:YD repeat-containing protein